MKRVVRLQAGLIASVAMLCTGVLAQSAPEPHVRVALKGYDPVAYFTEGKPVKGSPAIAFDFDEARYHFASPKHRDLFAGDPERYAPRFGGYCTGSMTRGVKNEGDPEMWVIEDGRLHVFGSGKGDAEGKAKARAGLERIRADPRGVIEAAERNWTKARQ